MNEFAKMKKTTVNRRKTMAVFQQPIPNKIQVDVNQSSSSTRLGIGIPQRKASTPKHDKTSRTESPDVSRIMPAETTDNGNGKRIASHDPIQVLCRAQDLSLADHIDIEYTHHLQTVFRCKLAEAETSQLDDKLTMLQKRIMENQSLLQKTTESLKNVNFNKEVETLHKLKYPNYGRILESLEYGNYKEYLEAENQKLEESLNQLRLKNIELPDSGSSELLKIVRDTMAACEQLKFNNNLELITVTEDIKTNNNNSSERLQRGLEVAPGVENLILDDLTFNVSAKLI